LKIKTVAVIGSGVMGQGIAQACAVAGFDVFLFDVDGVLTASAVKQLGANLSQAVSRGRMTEVEMRDALSRITAVATLKELRGALIIEAIVEKLQPKQELLATVEENNTGSILATNTSTFTVANVASLLKDPSACVGLHFFNPAHVMKLVEVIAGPATSAAVVQAATGFVKALQKVPVLANDSPGFIVNRVARSFYLEALKLMEENAAAKEALDNPVGGTGFGWGRLSLWILLGFVTNLG